MNPIGPLAAARRRRVMLIVCMLVLTGPAWAAAWEVVATGVARPLALAVDGQTLIVLSSGWTGALAGEIHRFPLEGPMPVDLEHHPGLPIPFTRSAPAILGSMALDPATHALYLGEENGARIWRLGADGQIVLYVTDLHRLAAGSSCAVDAAGRLIVIDYTDPHLSGEDPRGLDGLEQLKEEDYRGALVFRVTPDPTIPLPRRLSVVPPLFPAGWTRPPRPTWLVHLLSAVAPLGDDLVILDSSGEVFRLGADGVLRRYARLPSGQYTGAHMTVAPDGTIFVSAGFLVGRVFAIRQGGEVRSVGNELADPEGIALGPDGYLYVAESARHRIIRIRPF